MTLPIAVLASGRGSNLQAILDNCATAGYPAEVALVITDNAEAGALKIAARYGKAAQVIPRAGFADRVAFEAALADACVAAGAQLVCLAGFMRILGPRFLSAFPDRVLNIHPSLLPSFPGLEAQRKALEYGVKVAGCTVHFVDEKTDHGPIVLQAAVPVEPGDTVESLSTRILGEEHRIYPRAISLFAEGRLTIRGRQVHIAEG